MDISIHLSTPFTNTFPPAPIPQLRYPFTKSPHTPVLPLSHGDFLTSSKQKLHILRRQLLHCHLIIVNRPVNHIRLLLLQQHHPALDTIFNTQTRDDARAFLADTMTSICRLPLCGRVPPSVNKRMSVGAGRSNGERLNEGKLTDQ